MRFAKESLSTLGPGLTTGAADDDPSGIATYSQVGAQYGFQLLWLTLFTFPFMSIVQEMCARIGMVTGQGLATNIRKHYSRPILLTIATLLFIANTLNIAADLGAMAAATKLLIPHISTGLVMAVFAVLSLLLQIFASYASYSRYLKYLTLVLFSYVFTAFAVHLDWGQALRHTIIPSITFSRDQFFLLCAFLGTTISPYLFFWQTSQEVEEEILAGKKTVASRRGVTLHDIKKMRSDVWLGMFFSNAVAFFIIAACAATLFTHGITTITSAEQAASAIRPFAGELTYVFFAIGIIGTGFLAVPVLAGSTAYAIAESFKWREGLYRKFNKAYAFYGIIIVSVTFGLCANFLRIDPIHLLLYSAMVNGLIAPVILFFIIRISSNKRIMGDYPNHRLTTAGGWIIMSIMGVTGMAVAVSLFF